MAGGLDLLQADEVGEAQRLQPVHRQHEPAEFLSRHANGSEFLDLGGRTDITPLNRSRHCPHYIMSARS
jgi:hypothetical protein